MSLMSVFSERRTKEIAMTVSRARTEIYKRICDRLGGKLEPRLNTIRCYVEPPKGARIAVFSLSMPVLDPTYRKLIYAVSVPTDLYLYDEEVDKVNEELGKVTNGLCYLTEADGELIEPSNLYCESDVPYRVAPGARLRAMREVKKTVDNAFEKARDYVTKYFKLSKL